MKTISVYDCSECGVTVHLEKPIEVDESDFLACEGCETGEHSSFIACPFCNTMNADLESVVEENKLQHFVECKRCDARGPKYEKAGHAVRFWNERN
jgi:hypothetical protein